MTSVKMGLEPSIETPPPCPSEFSSTAVLKATVTLVRVALPDNATPPPYAPYPPVIVRLDMLLFLYNRDYNSRS